MAENLLFIDNDEKSTAELSVYLARHHYKVICADSWKTASGCLEAGFAGILLVDPNMSDSAYGNMRRQIKGYCRKLPVIIIAAPGDLDSAMEYFGAGAVFYLSKPLKCSCPSRAQAWES